MRIFKTSGPLIQILATIGFLATIVMLLYLVTFLSRYIPQGVRHSAAIINNQQRSIGSSTNITDAWTYTFNVDGTLHESGSADLSSSPYWWLSSGGMLIIEDGKGRTVTKSLERNSEWHWRYERNNPLDTDDGRHPQNLFRLLTKNTAGNAAVSVTFEVTAIHLTDTPNRGGYSGFFLMSRYQDSDNLYYAGVRQDGHSVIKKKIGGVYHTLAEEVLFTSLRPYERDTNPNLIPGKTPMGIRMETIDQDDGSVRVTLYKDQQNTGQWQEVLSAVDDNVGGPALIAPGRLGIRSDYMDVRFDDFSIEPI